MVKQHKEPDYMIWSCNDPGVRGGWICCDGDCWNCPHHYLKDMRVPDDDVFSLEDFNKSLKDLLDKGELDNWFIDK